MSEERIAQFEKMAEADPDNELGHFSLGKAYMDAERYDEGASALRRVLGLNPQLSKAYALLGFCEMKSGRKEAAVEVLREGFSVAHQRGDLRPRDEMAATMRELGVEPPAVRDAPAIRPVSGTAVAADAGGFRCKRCGGANRLEKPPLRGDLGQQIQDTTCRSCWQEWMATGTKVINELGLDLRSEQAQDAYDMHMKDYLGLQD